MILTAPDISPSRQITRFSCIASAVETRTNFKIIKYFQSTTQCPTVTSLPGIKKKSKKKSKKSKIKHLKNLKRQLVKVRVKKMGQTLSEPVTDKESSYCRNDLYRVGSSCMQGWRVKMEDSHTHILSLPDDPGTSFFAVYDGHGGATVAQYAGKHLHKFILKRPEYQSDVENALKQAFLDIDKDMLCQESWGEQMAGSTAVVALIKDNHLYCANAGDSRAIACINGEVEVLSLDHKPNNELETRRINEGGGWVEFNRVNGNLALSRALGDFVFKRNNDKKPEDQIVTAYPDVETREITEDWEFLVLACDGIWDVMSNKEVADFCRRRIGIGMYPETICEELMNHCLAPDCQMGGLGGDNMTVVLVCFLHKKPYATLVERCASSSHSDELIASSSNSTSSISSTGLPLEDNTPPAITTTATAVNTITNTTKATETTATPTETPTGGEDLPSPSSTNGVSTADIANVSDKTDDIDIK